MSEQIKVQCPVCGAKGVTLGHVLGHSAIGVKKTLSDTERKRRAERMAVVAKTLRWPAKRKEVSSL